MTTTYTQDEYISAVLEVSEELLKTMHRASPDMIREFCAKKFHENEVLSQNPDMVLNYSRSVGTMAEHWNNAVIGTIHAMVQDDEYSLDTYAEIQITAAMIAFGMDVTMCAIDFANGLSSIADIHESGAVDHLHDLDGNPPYVNRHGQVSLYYYATPEVARDVLDTGVLPGGMNMLSSIADDTHWGVDLVAVEVRVSPDECHIEDSFHGHVHVRVASEDAVVVSDMKESKINRSFVCNWLGGGEA